MAMGTRKQGERQEDLWIAKADLPRTAGGPLYVRLRGVVEEAGVAGFVEARCRRFYAEKMGRPSLAPGVYFRLLRIGYLEGLDSERGMAWRAADSLGLRRFLRIGLEEAPPDHSTISRTRRLMDVETHREVFTWVLGVLARKGLLQGKTLGVDATTLEANAALRSIVRRDSGESYQEFLTRLAQESGIETPAREERAAVYGNRRRIRGERGKQLLRRRGEFLERTFAHVYDTGGMRRTHLRGHRNILKRLLLHVAAFNLSLILRREAGAGTPRGLQDLVHRLFFCFGAVWAALESLRESSCGSQRLLRTGFRCSRLRVSLGTPLEKQ